jgi:Mg-chelatase subunit ChlD
MLVSPNKRRITLFDRKGGSENDVAIDQVLAIPESERDQMKGTWTLVVSDFAGKDVGTVRSWSLRLLGKPNGRRGKLAKSRAPIAIPDAPASGGGAGMHRVAIAAPTISTLTARLGRVALVKDHQFTRLEIDIARELRPLPKKAQVVFVLDLSRSIDEAEVQAQLELARGYLSHIPDAEFAMVGYARHARLLLGFSKASAGPRLLDRLSKGGVPELRNGSSLDRGLRKAEDLLAKRRGPKRIVVLTDALLRPSWKNQDALRHLSGGRDQPIVHVVVPTSNGSGLAERKDSHPLYPIAKRTGGILQTIDGLREEERKSIPELVLGLVRPTRIDHVTHNGPKSLSLPDLLDEGSAVREMLEVKRAPATLVVRGQIWSNPYRKVMRTQRWFDKVTAALIFPADLHNNLSKDEQYRIAMYGRAVSPVTSYLAIEPGVRPSTAGIVRRNGTGFGYGVGSGRGGFRGRKQTVVDWRKFYRSAIDACRKRHNDRKPLTLIIDTTKLETVDVEVKGVGGAMKSCAVEVGWNVELPLFNRERDRHTLRL